MRSFGGTAKRLQHARNFSEEPSSNFVTWIRNRLAQLVCSVQPVAVPCMIKQYYEGAYLYDW